MSKQTTKEKLNSIIARISDKPNTEVGTADRADAEQAILANVTKYWTEKAVYASVDIEQRFAVPPQFSLYLQHYSFIRQNQWKSLLMWDDIVSDMMYWYDYYLSYQRKAEAMMLLPLGGWSDKHWYFISCDNEQHFGEVFEAYDTDFFDIPRIVEEEWPDFLTFLESEFYR